MKIIDSISDCLYNIDKLASPYEDKMKKKYDVDENYNGPSWYKYHHNLWFRGQSDFSWQLLPRVCREDFKSAAKKSKDTIEGYEETAFNQFCIRTSHLLDKDLSIVEKYFLAQHYGLPTRLLDWTTNPLAALFFAVSENQLKDKNGALYAIYSRKDIPGYEHESILYNHRDSKKIARIINDIIKNKPCSDKFKYPIKIIPNLQKGRIISQNSRFSMHLSNSKKYDEIIGDVVFKFKINSEKKDTILRELSMLNINRASIFLDINNIVRDINSEILGKNE